MKFNTGIVSSVQWEIKTRSHDEIFSGLQTRDVCEHLRAGQFTSEDLGRTKPDQSWRQLGTIEEFAAVTPPSRRRIGRFDDDDDAMDMTPMIDVTFLLLIFFMITATFQLQKGLDFPPDRTEDQQTTQQPTPGLASFADRIIVGIDEQDQFRFMNASDGHSASGSLIQPDKLEQALKDVSQDEKKNRLLVLAHELASHEAVVKVIDSAALAGITDVALADVVSPSRPVSSQSPTVIHRP